MSKKKLTFEEALKQLDSIAEQIEKGQVGLEESITKYEEGMVLVKYCRDVLTQAELRIQKLLERPDGSLETTSFPSRTESPDQEEM